jgi:hypothetical protein
MKTSRALALFISAPLVVVGLVRLQRDRQERQARESEKAVLQRAPASGAKNSPMADAMAGTNEYLWLGEGIVRSVWEIRVPVDPLVERVGFSATGASRKCVLTVTSPAPAGARAAPALRSFELAMGVLVVVNKPAAGVWTLQVKGHDTIFVAAQAASRAGFDALTFSEDLMPLQAGQAVHAQARLSGIPAPVRFVVVAKDGAPLFSGVPLAPAGHHPGPAEGPAEDDYRFSFQAPKTSFRVVAVATDAQGHDIRRYFKTLWEPEL